MAIFDGDLKARTYRNFPVSDDGARIIVRSGGKRHFAPTFDNDSYIELPRRRLLAPWTFAWNRIYFVRSGSSACVNFKTEAIPGPDPELVKKAAGSEMLKNIGKEKAEVPIISYITLLVVILILLKVMGMIT